MIFQKRICRTIAILSVLCAPALPALGGGFTKKMNLKVRMSDGVNLSANVYLPRGRKKFATVLMRTPYGKDNMGWIAEPLAEAGFAVVAQSVRGQFGSEGTFVPFVSEKQDGLDTLDWIAKQRWCDGNIGMWGPSYLGYCALVVTPENHPNLKAVVNVSGWGDTTLMTVQGGAMHLMASLPWTLSNQISGSSGGGLNWDEAFKRTPVIDIPSSYGYDSAQWKAIIRLYNSADTEGRMRISHRYDDIRIPTLHFSGWYDFVGPTTIDAFEGIDQAARKRGDVTNKLVVGPWLHNQIYNGGTLVGEENFPASIEYGVDKLAQMSAQWFDRWLLGKDSDIMKEQPVELFVMGENQWRSFDQWPPKSVSFEPWYFASDKGANSAMGDGTLSTAKPRQSGADRFVYDPMNPVPTNGGANYHGFPGNTGIKNQRKLERRDDVLVYTSEVFERDTTFIGPVKAVLYASTEGRQTDFTAKLVEVRSRGYAANIVDSIKRGPDLINGKKVEMMEPGKVYRFTIDMDATAITIKREAVSASRSPAVIFPNTPATPILEKWPSTPPSSGRSHRRSTTRRSSRRTSCCR